MRILEKGGLKPHDAGYKRRQPNRKRSFEIPVLSTAPPKMTAMQKETPDAIADYSSDEDFSPKELSALHNKRSTESQTEPEDTPTKKKKTSDPELLVKGNRYHFVGIDGAMLWLTVCLTKNFKNFYAPVTDIVKALRYVSEQEPNSFRRLALVDFGPNIVPQPNLTHYAPETARPISLENWDLYCKANIRSIESSANTEGYEISLSVKYDPQRTYLKNSLLVCSIYLKKQRSEDFVNTELQF